jgi:LPS-assembly lipoprotein
VLTRAARAGRFAALATVAAALALLGACGLHLQGRDAAPARFRTVYIETENRQSDFVQALTRSLLANGAAVSRDLEQSEAVIRIISDSVAEQVLTVSARNIPTAYELTYTVKFAVAQGTTVLLEPQEVSQTRDFTFDESILLAKNREQAILVDAMANDLAAIVMRRLAAL